MEAGFLPSKNHLTDMRLQSLSYSLDMECPVPWTSSQEATISQDYPFQSTDEVSPDDFVARRYVETLWLPESIMPLQHFVQSLRRVVASRSPTHPLHTALKPLFLSVRATHEKYHVELPQILHDGGGSEELEEAMMWFAWSKERFESEGRDGSADKEAEEAWRKGWMERLERREVQIQILLYLQLLTLPPLAAAPTTPPRTPKKRRPKQVHGPPSPIKPIFPPTSSIEAAVVASAPPTPAKSVASSATAATKALDESLSVEDRLEYFMDRLSLWQLIASLNSSDSSQPQATDNRDWMQVFCEDVVEPLFKDQLPEQCALLRTKVFPHSPFSEDEDDASSSPPPDLRARAKGKTKGKRPPSPLRLEELEKHPPQTRAGSVQRADSVEPGVPEQYRSRSRSVSISMEEVRARGASRGGVASSKNLFKGEVEMKRTASRGSKLFKPRQASASQQQANGRELTRSNSRTNNALSSGSQPRASQPSQPRSSSQSREPRTLAADTPTKKPVKVEDSGQDIIMDSPDPLLLKTSDRMDLSDGEDGGDSPRITKIVVADTPVKKISRR